MRVLMFGWEFPPYNSGGLGVACLGLSTALAKKDLEVLFVLPKKMNIESDFIDFAYADVAEEPDPVEKNLSITYFNSILAPYQTSTSYVNKLREVEEYVSKEIYGDSLMTEVIRYGIMAEKLALTKEFDVIHAHDWLSIPAGITAKKVTGKPLFVHIHATQYNHGAGMGVDDSIVAIEKEGMQQADKVIAVSEFVKQTIIKEYGIDGNKIEVVHNGINFVEFKHEGAPQPTLKKLKESGYKIVLSLGRLTAMKGIPNFLRAAARALEKDPMIKFFIVGSGDLEDEIIRTAAGLGIADSVLMPGFVRGNDLTGTYATADLFVLPSVSEPFGLVALEAVANDIPVIVSKQSGVAEVLDHAIKVDFWDDQAMADAIVGILNNPEMHGPMVKGSKDQAAKLTWGKAAGLLKTMYAKVISS